MIPPISFQHSGFILPFPFICDYFLSQYKNLVLIANNIFTYLLNPRLYIKQFQNC